MARDRRSARVRADGADGDERAPRLPRGKGLSLTGGPLLKIALTAALLVMLIVLQRPCADSVSTFVTSFGSADERMPKPGTVDPGSGSGSGSALRYELIHPGMTEAEQAAAIERELARARQRAAGSAGSAGSGSSR